MLVFDSGRLWLGVVVMLGQAVAVRTLYIMHELDIRLYKLSARIRTSL
jgi:hypothetical protein